MTDRSGRLGTIEPRAVLGGFVTAVICVGIGLISALGVREVFHWTKSGTSTLTFVFAGVGFLLGGFRAGLLYPSAPLSNGAVAAMLAYIPLGVGQRLIAGKDVRFVSVVFAALFAACFGIFGGYVANNANKMRAHKNSGTGRE
jgi:hypothetical protein